MIGIERARFVIRYESVNFAGFFFFCHTLGRN